MAINRIDHAAVRVNDLGKALEWYEDVLGLTVLDRNASRVHLACAGEAADITLVAGGQSIETFAFGVDDEGDLDEAAHRLTKNGIAHEFYKDPDRPGEGALLGFRLPSGQKMELAVGADGRVAGKTELKSDGTHRPTDIDHINLLGEVDPGVITEFLMIALGFKHTLKLTVAGAWVGTWLRAQQVDHDIAYMVAMRPADRLHHVAFAMEDGNHYFRLSDRLAEFGHTWEFGPGRHMAFPRQPHGRTSNTFAYAFDPTGNRNEFSSQMPIHADDSPTGVLDLHPDEVAGRMNGWANNMPATFLTQGS